MKNISLVFNVILLAGLIVLYILFFSAKHQLAEVKKAADEKNDTTPAAKLTFNIPKNLAGARVLYVNIDSLNKNYLAIAEMQAKFDQNGGHLEQRYEQKQQELQARYAAYQQRVKMGTISADDAQKIEDGLNRGSDSLAQMQMLMNNFQESMLKQNAMVIDEVSKYFKDYSKQKKIDFILSYGGQSNVLYANDSLDVTRDVVNALNDQYRQNKGKK